MEEGRRAAALAPLLSDDSLDGATLAAAGLIPPALRSRGTAMLATLAALRTPPAQQRSGRLPQHRRPQTASALTTATASTLSSRPRTRARTTTVSAKRIASALSVRCLDRFLKVTRVACKQGTLDAASRRINVKDLFAIRHRRTIHHFHGKNVLLVDDIMTSGATVNELARLLIRNGVRQVLCATVARGAA